MVRHVILAVWSGSVVLTSVHTEHREVAGLPRPHPVVGLSTVFSHRLRQCEDQSEVGEVLVCGGIVLVSLIERVYLYVQGAVDSLHGIRHGIRQRVEDCRLFHSALARQHRQYLCCYILLVAHEADKHILVWQFLVVALGIEAVEHVVVLHRRMTVYGREATVVVCEDKSVGRHHHSGAIAGKVHHVVLYCILTLVEVRVRQCETFRLHLLVYCLRQVIQCPHALVGR